MTPESFVGAYLALVDVYVAMSQEEKEQVAAAFVKERAEAEGWRKVVSA